MTKPRQPEPSDRILDRYLAGASDETREQARGALRRFAKALLRIAKRQAREDLALIDSSKTAIGARMAEAP